MNQLTDATAVKHGHGLGHVGLYQDWQETAAVASQSYAMLLNHHV